MVQATPSGFKREVWSLFRAISPGDPPAIDKAGFRELAAGIDLGAMCGEVPATAGWLDAVWRAMCTRQQRRGGHPDRAVDWHTLWHTVKILAGPVRQPTPPPSPPADDAQAGAEGAAKLTLDFDALRKLTRGCSPPSRGSRSSDPSVYCGAGSESWSVSGSEEMQALRSENEALHQRLRDADARAEVAEAELRRARELLQQSESERAALRAALEAGRSPARSGSAVSYLLDEGPDGMGPNPPPHSADPCWRASAPTST
eukprot:TRINITY_DN17378_c0_g1_i1.p1 TRINITY_DN17378_c0_g1~~TRINITY_DN17378_c0_g1_i1.p1  ORF type:complete len:274 (+),score=77.82 TRINITY_DN17378_c0_g1_i1:50-823(+)